MNVLKEKVHSCNKEHLKRVCWHKGSRRRDWKFLKDKKGSEFDIIFIMYALVVMSAVMLFSVKIIDEYRFVAEDMLNDSDAGEEIFKSTATKLLPMFDNIVFGMFFVLMGLSLIGALFVKSHPVFFFVSIFVLAIVMVLSVLYANLSDMFTNSELTTYKVSTVSFDKTIFLLDNLPLIAFGFSILLLVLLYGFGGGKLFGGG